MLVLLKGQLFPGMTSLAWGKTLLGGIYVLINQLGRVLKSEVGSAGVLGGKKESESRDCTCNMMIQGERNGSQ